MATVSLRPHIVRVMSEHRERPLSTREIYEAVATMGVVCSLTHGPSRTATWSTGSSRPWHQPQLPQQARAAAAHGPGLGEGVFGTGGGVREAAAAG